MITSLEQLRTLYAQPAERAVRKQLDHLDAYCLLPTHHRVVTDVCDLHGGR